MREKGSSTTTIDLNGKNKQKKIHKKHKHTLMCVAWVLVRAKILPARDARVWALL